MLQTLRYIQQGSAGDMVRFQATALLCAYCSAEIRFEEGDVIFGDAWFHKECAPKFRLSLKREE